MNLRQSLYSVLLVLLSLTGLAAQTKGGKELSTTELLAQAEKSLYRSGATVLEFSTVLKGKSKQVQAETSGKMYLQGDAFRLEYGTITAVYAAGTLTYYDKAEHTLTLSAPTQEELLQLNPLLFLRSRAQGFHTKIQAQSATHATVLFSPQSAKSNIKQVFANFQKSTGVPSQLVFLAKDNTTLTAAIARVTHRAAYPASYYQLHEKDYPGCEVVDLR